ncbi:HEAT repeat domain-containing protein [Stomatobaculum longum]|uniref:HEAT repeat domain-containing protein n=1 Tax=Stomatobaculum longum TaxID=796942 RepID=UPI0028EB6AC9|nr:HEAT repeat domain-containing protein [Stomatobaculum longum]
MRKSYRELTEEIKTDGERLKLIAALGSSDDLAYHYALICEDWAAGGKLMLENSFDRHGEAGIVFLLERLRALGTASKTDESAAAGTATGTGAYTDTAYLAAKILSQLRHKDFYAARAKELAALLTASWKISDIALRRKQIIALGWIGSESAINLLIDSMQSDSDALCRAWAAAALMQLSFHAVDAAFLRERTKTAFAAAIQKEGDLNAAGILIEAAQTLFGKKWISAAAAEAAESESIEKARKSALRFLGKA